MSSLPRSSGEGGGVNNKLSKGDVGLLTELLTEVKPKGEELGIALGLQKHEMPNRSNQDRSVVYLRDILHCWIANDSDASLSKLREALCSNTVGESRVGEQLRVKFFEMKEEGVHLAKSEDSINGKSTVQSQPGPREGTSTTGSYTYPNIFEETSPKEQDIFCCCMKLNCEPFRKCNCCIRLQWLCVFRCTPFSQET